MRPYQAWPLWVRANLGVTRASSCNLVSYQGTLPLFFRGGVILCSQRILTFTENVVLSLFLYHSHSFTFTLSLSLFHSHTFTLSLSVSLLHSHSFSLTLSLWLSLSNLSLSLFLNHSFTLTLSFLLFLSHSFSLTFSFSLFHYHSQPSMTYANSILGQQFLLSLFFFSVF